MVLIENEIWPQLVPSPRRAIPTLLNYRIGESRICSRECHNLVTLGMTVVGQFRVIERNGLIDRVSGRAITDIEV